MANSLAKLPSNTLGAPGLIAGPGDFTVDFNRPLPEGGGGQQAFAAHGGSTSSPPLMAVKVQRGWPARAHPIQALASATIGNLLIPLGHGPTKVPSGEVGYFVVTAAPPGRPLSATDQPWSEADLVDRLLRPAVGVLLALEKAGLTHRAIRADNVFLAAPGAPVTLGSAWAAPAGCQQPPVADPPYFAVCHPAGRGDGSIADDVYAIGVLIVWLALGRDPMAGFDAETIIERKLDLGSFEAVVGQHRLPGGIADLVRGMLADDPEHRSSPALLSDPAAARARRNVARPMRRAQRPLQIGSREITTPRLLAYAMLRNPAECLVPLRNGVVEHWLRRGIGDPGLATRLDETLRDTATERTPDERMADAMAIMSAVAILDPLAPLAWRGTVFWPDGLATALNHTLQLAPGSPTQSGLTEIAGSGVIEAWATLRGERANLSVLRSLVRQFKKWHSAKPIEQAALRLSYALNPLAPCESPVMAPAWVTRLGELLPAMEAAIALGRREQVTMDRHVTAFIAVRRDERGDRSVGLALGLMNATDPVASLRLAAALQSLLQTGPLPHLAASMVEGVTAIVSTFHSASRRQRLAERLAALVQAGDLPGMLSTLQDGAETDHDTRGLAIANARAAEIDRTLRSLATRDTARRTAAQRMGHEMAYGAGMLACAIALASAIFT